MLIACDACGRQYDVGDLTPGSKIRCLCGQMGQVPQPRTREAPMQRCASCGGELTPGAERCGYCDAGVTIAERGWGESCPGCYARLIKDAKFCSACGVAIRPEVVRKSTRSERCPRCKATMVVCELPGGQFVECTGCGGVWLEEGAFEQLATKQEQQTAVASYFTTPERQDTARLAKRQDEVRYLSCPICKQHMNRKNFAKVSGVIIDWCRGHGYWFDAHELERILAFVAQGGLEKSRRREIEEQERQVKLAKERAAQARAAGPGGYREPISRSYGRGGTNLLGEVLGGILRGLLD